jgi:hypothetical protein
MKAGAVAARPDSPNSIDPKALHRAKHVLSLRSRFLVVRFCGFLSFCIANKANVLSTQTMSANKNRRQVEFSNFFSALFFFLVPIQCLWCSA